METLLSTLEASRILKISIHTMRAWIGSGKIPVVKMGRKNLLRERDLENMIQKGFRPTKNFDN
jgi:excisionase family DNA binding protein